MNKMFDKMKSQAITKIITVHHGFGDISLKLQTVNHMMAL